MRHLTFTILLTAVPSLVLAQTSATATGSGQTEAALSTLSADGRARAEAGLQAAANEGLPQEPLLSVLLEGRAKGAAEAQILRAEEQQLARLRAASHALVEAGRPQPSGEEVSGAANAMARGVSEAQLMALVERSPSDRSLVATLETHGTDLAASSNGDIQGTPSSASAGAGAAASTSVATSAGPAASGSIAGSITAGVTRP
jgi:hypothetical protein